MLRGIATVQRLWQDRRGTTVIQFVLVLPIFLLLLFGAYELWRLVAIKQRLEAATIQATRYLMVEGRFLIAPHRAGAFPYEWENLAREIIVDQLVDDPLVGGALANSVQVVVDTPTRFAPTCPGGGFDAPVNRLRNAQFSVTAALRIPSPLRIPFLGVAEGIVLQETHTAYVEC